MVPDNLIFIQTNVDVCNIRIIRQFPCIIQENGSDLNTELKTITAKRQEKTLQSWPVIFLLQHQKHKQEKKVNEFDQTKCLCIKKVKM